MLLGFLCVSGIGEHIGPQIETNNDSRELLVGGWYREDPGNMTYVLTTMYYGL